MWKMYVVGSGTSQRSAKPGATFKSFPRESRSSKIRLSMRSDCASIPTRGSRFVGLDSIIMTSVFGSGLDEQERTGKTRKPKMTPTANRRTTDCGPLVLRSEGRGLRSEISGMRDLPQHRGPSRTRSRRHIRRPPVPGFIGQHSKRHRLFRRRRQAELLRESNPNAERCQSLGNHLQQSPILRAATGENDFTKSLARMDAPLLPDFGRSGDF